MRSVWGLPWYCRDFVRFRRSEASFALKARLADLFPITSDRNAAAGGARGHYFNVDLWVARQVYHRAPRRHVDIGSRIDGFVSHLLVFREVEVVDIRPLRSEVDGLRFVCDDATELRHFADQSLESISTLHAAEHFGLGRYGDPVDPDAWLHFARSLCRVLAPGGDLYFAVPCGRERVEFNAQRVFDPRTISRAFSALRLMALHGVVDSGAMVMDIPEEELAKQEYGCGVFHFSRRN